MPNRFDVPRTGRQGVSEAGADKFSSYGDGARSKLEESVDFARRVRDRGRRPTHGWAALTRAEIAVAREIAAGRTNTQAAGTLFIAPCTIKTHLERIYTKLDIHGRAALATQVARHDKPPLDSSKLH